MGEQNGKIYRTTLAALYLFLIMGVLPLYMKNGMVGIGDGKYTFYRNISLFFLLLWILGTGYTCWERIRGFRPGLRGRLRFPKKVPLMEGAAALYGVSVLLSYGFSPYKETALWGYPGWYMGMVTQLLLLWGCFLIASWYEREKYVETAVLVSAAAVFLLGLLNRFGADPLGIYEGMDWFSWNRRNLLSTIGNINWYCSYLCLMLPLFLGLYCLWAGRRVVRFLLGGVSWIGIGALLLQGSESGYAALAVLFAVMLYFVIGNRDRELRLLELGLMTVSICAFLDSFLKWIKWGIVLPEENHVEPLLHLPVWLPVFVGLLLLYGILRYRKSKGAPELPHQGRSRKILCFLYLLAAVLLLLLLAACSLSKELWEALGAPGLLRLDEQWGGERGLLWKLSWQEFLESDLPRKLFGAGPDCFADYMYGHNAMEIAVYGQWQGAKFANAHNEWLTMLVNQGILGLAGYLGFLGAAFCRFLKGSEEKPLLFLGALAVAGYCANNFFSFQQVVSTPLLFLLIGFFENRRLSG